MCVNNNEGLPGHLTNSQRPAQKGAACSVFVINLAESLDALDFVGFDWKCTKMSEVCKMHKSA